MQNSKLIQVLKTFSKEEWKGFEKLASSSFFNGGRNLVPFIKELKKFSPDFSAPRFTKEYIYSKVHPGEKYNANTMKGALSVLLDMAEEFLAQTALKEDGFTKKIKLMNKLMERNIDSLFEYHFKKTKADSGKEIEKQIQLKELRYQFNLRRKLMKEYSEAVIEFSNLKTLDLVKELFHNLIIFNTTEESFNISSSGSLSNLLLRNINVDEFYSRVKVLQKEFFYEFNFNYYLFKSETEPEDVSHYMKCREIYFKMIDSITHYNKFNYFRFLESYLIRMRAKKIIDIDWASQEQNELGKEVLKNNIYSFNEDGYLEANTFMNILSNALDIRDFGFAEELINTHIQKIDPKNIDNVKNLSFSWYYFITKEYDKSLSSISEVKFLEKDVFFIRYKQALRILKMMVYYELKYTENLISEIDAFKHYLMNSDEVSESSRNKSLSFVKNIEKLLKFSLRTTDKNSLEKFYREVKIENADRSNNWLREKIQELIGAKPEK